MIQLSPNLSPLFFFRSVIGSVSALMLVPKLGVKTDA